MPYMALLNEGETITTLENRSPTFAFGFIEFNKNTSRPNIEGLGFAGSIFIQDNKYDQYAHQFNASIAMGLYTIGIADGSLIVYKSDIVNLAKEFISSNNSSSSSPILDLVYANSPAWDGVNSVSVSDQVTANKNISDNISGFRGEFGEASSSSIIRNPVELNTSSSRISSILGEKETFEKAFLEERENSLSRKRKFSEAFPEEVERSYKGKSRKL